MAPDGTRRTRAGSLLQADREEGLMRLTEERRKEIEAKVDEGWGSWESPGEMVLEVLAALTEAERGLAAAHGEASFFQTAHEQVESRVRELEEENARLLEIQRGQQATAEAYPGFTTYTFAQQTGGRYLAPSQVQQVREAQQQAIDLIESYRTLLERVQRGELLDIANVPATMVRIRAGFSLLGGKEEVRWWD